MVTYEAMNMLFQAFIAFAAGRGELWLPSPYGNGYYCIDCLSYQQKEVTAHYLDREVHPKS